MLGELASDGLVASLSARDFRRVDETATSILLNIAEGNGRFAELHRRRFLRAANRATVKLAALLDVLTVRGMWEAREVRGVRELLVRVANMTAVMAGLRSRQGSRWRRQRVYGRRFPQKSREP